MAQFSVQKYDISIVAGWFHIFPHVDISFAPVNATFDLSSNAYLEALGILIAIPGFWLILTLLAFLIFFLCRCCDASFKKKKKLTPLKWTLGIFAILCCCALAVGLFGNDQAHNGIIGAHDATASMQGIVESIRNETTVIETTLQDGVNPDLDKLANAFTDPLANTTINVILQNALSSMRSNVTQGLAKITEINGKVDQVTFKSIPYTIHQVELIRWPTTIALLSVLFAVCLILLWGLIRHSRCILILFSVLGLLSVVICWVLVSLYLGICVAGSDFCLDPDPFIYKQASSAIEKNILTYYIQCDDKTPSPFIGSIKDGVKAVNSVETTLVLVTKISSTFYPQKEIEDILAQLARHLNRTEKVLGGMTALLDCQVMHKEYNSAMESICVNGLEGTAYMLVSAAGAGLFFTVLIWVASHTWIHIRKKRPTEHVDEEDPFLPPSAVGSNPRRNRDTYGSTGVRPRFSHTPPQTPHFTASLNGRSESREDHAILQGRYTPPPAYDQLSGGPLVGSLGFKAPMKG